MGSAKIEEVGIDIGDILYWVHDHTITQVIVVPDDMDCLPDQVTIGFLKDHIDNFFYDIEQAIDRRKFLDKISKDLDDFFGW